MTSASSTALEAVYADPVDDAKRAACAAALTANGDLRGEFITLQLERARAQAENVPVAPEKVAREVALAKKHAKDWIGALANVTVRSSLVFEKGFLAAATFKAKKASDVTAAVGAPEWSTVRVLTRAGFNAVPPEIIAHPVLRSLVTVGIDLAYAGVSLRPAAENESTRMTPSAACDPVSLATAAAIMDGPEPRALESLGIYREHSEVLTDAIAASFSQARAVPHLRHIELALTSPPAAYRWFYGSPLARRVETAIFVLDDFATGACALGPWLEELSETRVSIDFVLAHVGLALRFSRDAAGSPSVLDVHLRPTTTHPRAIGSTLAWLLADVPRDALTAVRVHDALADPAPVFAEAKKQTRLRELAMP